MDLEFLRRVNWYKLVSVNLVFVGYRLLFWIILREGREMKISF